MRKGRIVVAAFVISLCWHAPAARADKLEDDLNTVWESLWDQRGALAPVVRWEGEVPFRFFGPDSARHQQHLLGAIQSASQVTGLRFKDVSADADAEKTARLHIEVANNSALNNNEPCRTRFVQFAVQELRRVNIQMRSSEAWRCTHHEVMHAMGISGHPSGKTVLSYFPYRRDVFMELDKLMLRAWYSAEMRAPTTPLQALDVLVKTVAAQTDLGLDAAEAARRASAFGMARVAELQALAQGNGDVPAIVKRSGKFSGNSSERLRLDAGFYVGLAYLQGTIVGKDEAQAAQWLKETAQRGYLPAQIMWSAVLADGTGVAVDIAEAYVWMYRAALSKPALVPVQKVLAAIEKKLPPDAIESLRARVALGLDSQAKTGEKVLP